MPSVSAVENALKLARSVVSNVMNRLVADFSPKNHNTKGRLQTGDLFIAFFVVLIALFLFSLQARHANNAACKAEIRIKGKTVQTVALDRDGTYAIGNFAELTVSSGTVMLTQADCPNHDCLHMGAIRTAGQMLVCVPNELVIRIIGDSETEVDAVAY